MSVDSANCNGAYMAGGLFVLNFSSLDRDHPVPGDHVRLQATRIRFSQLKHLTCLKLSTAVKEGGWHSFP